MKHILRLIALFTLTLGFILPTYGAVRLIVTSRQLPIIKLESFYSVGEKFNCHEQTTERAYITIWCNDEDMNFPPDTMGFFQPSDWEYRCKIADGGFLCDTHIIKKTRQDNKTCKVRLAATADGIVWSIVECQNGCEISMIGAAYMIDHSAPSVDS